MLRPDEIVVIDGETFLLVHPLGGCPECEEQNIDNLVWDEDGIVVICQTCGKNYTS